MDQEKNGRKLIGKLELGTTGVGKAGAGTQHAAPMVR